MTLIYNILLFSYLSNVLLTESAYNSSCIGCTSWKCDDYDSNTPSYDTCVANNGCIYCYECEAILTPQCESTCDMESKCNDSSSSSLSSGRSDATKWWLIAGFSIGALCFMFVFVIVLYIYRITKDDHELAMMKIQRKNSRQKLTNDYSNSSRIDSKMSNKKHQKQSSKLSPVPEPHRIDDGDDVNNENNESDHDEDYDSDDIRSKERNIDINGGLNRVTTQSETHKNELVMDDDVVVHTIKISVDSPKSSEYYQHQQQQQQQQNDDARSQSIVEIDSEQHKPKMSRFDSV